MGYFVFINGGGDTRIEWDPDDYDSVLEAEKKFDKAIELGFTPHRERSDGKPGRILEDFDPTASKIVMCPLIEGG